MPRPLFCARGLAAPLESIQARSTQRPPLVLIAGSALEEVVRTRKRPQSTAARFLAGEPGANSLGSPGPEVPPRSPPPGDLRPIHSSDSGISRRVRLIFTSWHPFSSRLAPLGEEGCRLEGWRRRTSGDVVWPTIGGTACPVGSRSPCSRDRAPDPQPYLPRTACGAQAPVALARTSRLRTGADGLSPDPRPQDALRSAGGGH